MKPSLRRTALALALAQLFSSQAYANTSSTPSDDSSNDRAGSSETAQSAIPAGQQSVAEVIVSASKATAAPAAISHTSGFIGQDLISTPFTVSVVTAEQMRNLQIRQTSDAMKYDASVNDAYNAVGYAEQFSIRGYMLDNESSYKKDGFTIPADSSIPLENKERIEVLKGISGFQSGFSTPGGVINYITKRPTSTDLRSVSSGISERGTLYAAADLGGLLKDGQFGYRINVAGERMRSYVVGADGERQFFSAAFDWHITPDALLQIDADYQHKSQLSAPGFQLFNGSQLPQGISADMMLNNQPWARPVDTRTANLGLRFEYQLNADWSASVAANRHQFKRDDYTAFPYGCASSLPGSGYCGNGDYDVYDYQSVGEFKNLWGSQALLNGKFNIAGLQNQLAVGLSDSERHDFFGNYVYDYVGTSNIFRPVVTGQSANTTGPVLLQRSDREWSAFAQDILHLNDQWQLQVGVRHVQISRSQLELDGYSQGHWLSNAALLFQATPTLSWYASFAQGLDHGGIAPFGTNNQNQMMNPARSRQLELGLKAELANNLSINAALFQIRKPLEYTDINNNYVQNGLDVHTGLELSAQGRLSSNFSLMGSLMALKATQQDTGDATLDGLRTLDVPRLKASLYGEYQFSQLPDLSLNGGWQYSGNKAFSPDNSVIIPGYQTWNIGARYQTKTAGIKTTVRLNVDNLFDKFYWRDATQLLGGYLFPGAPRTVRLSAQFDF